MPFALNGTHIEGGTFNNVAGNVTQVFNSRIGPIRAVRPSDHSDPSRIDSRNPSSQVTGYRSGVGNDAAAQFIPSMPLGDEDRGFYPADISTTYNSVAGNMTQLNVKSYGESGIDTLYRSVVIEALHDSRERFPEPACHPGTGTRVLEMLRAWSVDRNPESTILWLYGAAGMGKSAIAQMFAGDLHNQGRLGASFFFRRGHSKRGTWDGLFATLAYQLATSVSELFFPIQRAVEADKLIVGRAMTAQFQKLLLHPFQNTPTNRRFIPVIVIDGLDECKDHKIQQQIVHLFVTAIRNHCLPVRLLVTSRPEPHIREALGPQDILTICRHSELCADDSAYADIRIYLCDEFSRIYHEFLDRGIDLGRSWPAREAVMHLVKKSSGIFIYAATVIRFIGDEYTHPAERLTAVLRLDPRSTAPLDDLYTEILSVVSPDTTRLRVLHAIWQGTQDNHFNMRPEHIETLLLLPPGSARLALRAFHSLLQLPPMYTSFSFPKFLRPLHASLGDYLGDPRRSGRWCVSVPWLHSDFLHCVLRLLSSPCNTVDTRNFHTNIVGGLPMLLSRFAPTETLIGLLRNKQVQKAMFFHFANSKSWPKRDSGYPRDLIRLWDDHRFIVELVDCPPTTYQTSPTYKFDGLYRGILCRNADLLFLLRSKIRKPYDLIEVVFLLGPHYDPEVFRPLLKLRELVKLPLKPGDSPFDFLKEPDRAGDLYSPQQDIAEDLVLLWILNARTRLKERTWISRHGAPTFYWLDLLAECRPSLKIAHELKSLDLAQICHPRNISPADHHHEVHLRMFSNPKPARAVLDWLQKFPDPPLQAIAFWERQRIMIDQCVYKDGAS